MATVFVSHRSTDGVLAEKLSCELTAAGHTVWLDKWRIELGDSIVERIGHGLDESEYVLVCYSAADVLAPWMSREWMSTLARQLDGHRVRLLPVRLSGGRPPALLADIKYADLVADWDTGVRQLLAVLR